MTRKTFIAVYALGALLVLVLALGATYYALTRLSMHRCPACSGAAQMQGWSSRAGLTPEQRRKIAPDEANLQGDIGKLQTQIGREQLALCGLFEKEPAASPNIEAQINRIGALQMEQQRRVARHIMTLREALTPAQRDVLFTSLKKGVCAGCQISAGAPHCPPKDKAR